MTNTGPSVYQTSHQLACEVLRKVLVGVVESGSGNHHGTCSVMWRAGAALYSLLLDHPVDRPGRCRSCRRPGAVLGQRHRRCRVRVTAGYWLHQPDENLLLTQLARELNTPHHQTPAVPSPLPPSGELPQAGRPAPSTTGPARPPGHPAPSCSTQLGDLVDASAVESVTDVPPDQVATGDGGFSVGLHLPDVQCGIYHDDAEHYEVLLYRVASDSAASVTVTPHAVTRRRYPVRQHGPRPLWDEAERAYHWWAAHRRPARTRYGLTVTTEHQRIWLDEPANTLDV